MKKILLVLIATFLPVRAVLKKSKSYPYLDRKSYEKKIRNHLKDMSTEDQIIIQIPQHTKNHSEHTQISITSDDEVVSNINRCPPGKAAVMVAIITAGVGVCTGILTAAITLIVHFTTK